MSMQKLYEAAAKKGVTKEELDFMLPTLIELQKDKDIQNLKKISKAKGGNISRQMEMFEEGGLKDEGGTVDEESGNDVPIGSTKEEVRDDIPAQLSEGEFVFPADVVRYIGLEKLMQLRQDAKQGLKTMEEMGQMGNSDEATMPDDLPFDITDLDIEDEEEYNRGGVVYAAEGFAGQKPKFKYKYKPKKENVDKESKRVPSDSDFFNSPEFKEYKEKLGENPIGTMDAYESPYFGFQGSGSIGRARDRAYEAWLKRTGGKETSTKSKGKLKFKDLIGVGGKAEGAADEYKTYINEAGDEIQVPFKDGKILVGYNIPEGYMLKTENVDKTQSQTKRVQTARVQDTDDGGDDTGVSDLGGARTTIGGVEYAVQYNFDGTVGLASVQDYKTTGKANFNKVSPALADQIKTQAIGQVAELAKVTGLKTIAVSELAKKFGVELPGVKKLDTAIAKAKNIQKEFDRGFKPEEMFDMGKSYLDKEFEEKVGRERSEEDKLGFEGLGEKGMRSIQGGLQFGRGDQINQGLDDDFVDSLGDIDKGITDDSFKTPTVESGTAGSSDAPDLSTQEGRDSTYGNNYSDDDGGSSVGGPGGGYGDSAGSYGGMGDFNIGGLAGKKKKIKVKKMKRGGLASKK